MDIRLKENHNKSHIIKLSFAYTISIIILICIPAYLYMQSEINSYKFNQYKTIDEHSLNIQRAIYDFNDSKNMIFRFPKSFLIDSYLLSKNKELIFSTTSQSLNYKNNISKQVTLSSNRLDAKYLIVTKKFTYKQIYLKIAILTLCIGLFIFISAYLIIKQSIIPYKEANTYLDAFFNDAMHELKTPLGVIQLNLEILEEKQKTKELSRALNGVKNLHLIYDDIEYLIKKKRVIYKKENTNFSELLNQRINIFESLALSKEIKINTNITEDIKIEFNRTELQRIIDNTISNAIKYSKAKNKIIIQLRQEEKIKFIVEDFGSGIKDTSKIFDRYYRENSIKGGFGIGLNIVKNICDKNDVQIVCNTELKKGTSFIYTFNT